MYHAPSCSMISMNLLAIASSATAQTLMAWSSIEHDGLVAVHEHAVAEVQVDGAGEHDLLEIAALAHQVVDGVAVADSGDVLLDDRSLVQLRRGVVRRRADDLHAAFVRLVVWACAGERGQELVVDVDDAVRIA